MDSIRTIYASMKSVVALKDVALSIRIAVQTFVSNSIGKKDRKTQRATWFYNSTSYPWNFPSKRSEFPASCPNGISYAKLIPFERRKETQYRGTWKRQKYVWEAKRMVGEARDQAFDIWEKVYGDKIIVSFFVDRFFCDVGYLQYRNFDWLLHDQNLQFNRSISCHD